ncbi:MAG: GNAT family N-acetyltransferase [Flavobacteriaceae bacterium]
MGRILETERLYLRKFMLKDASALFKLNSNPNVLQYTGDVPFKNISTAEEFIKNYTHYDEYNMGRWAVCEKRQGELVGWCGLKFHPEDDSIDLGYRFFEKHWNKGLATEATKGVISYAFNKLRIQDIYLYADKRNIASMAVAKKTGFTLKEEKNHEGRLTQILHIKNNLVEVKEITSVETYSIRHQVLRQGKPIETCQFEGDDLKTTIHLGLYYYNKLIGVASYMKVPSPLFQPSEHYQLRGMAILQQFQGKKFGNVLLEYGEKSLRAKNCDLIWCNARASAQNFYTNYDFKTTGEAFDIPEIGTHFVMYKYIK